MGEPEGLFVDHKDGNGLNNRRLGENGNLRTATHAQNQQNMVRRRNNSSGYKGVTRSMNGKKWVASILAFGESHHLGTHGCPTAAHIAYVKASRELHGEFGRVA